MTSDHEIIQKYLQKGSGFSQQYNESIFLYCLFSLRFLKSRLQHDPYMKLPMKWNTPGNDPIKS
jgi:hypothetical protein